MYWRRDKILPHIQCQEEEFSKLYCETHSLDSFPSHTPPQALLQSGSATRARGGGNTSTSRAGGHDDNAASTATGGQQQQATAQQQQFAPQQKAGALLQQRANSLAASLSPDQLTALQSTSQDA